MVSDSHLFANRFIWISCQPDETGCSYAIVKSPAGGIGFEYGKKGDWSAIACLSFNAWNEFIGWVRTPEGEFAFIEGKSW